MAVQIQLRRDTAANWTSINPTLAQGEVGVETDTDKSKIGNGTDNWATLPYWVDPGAGGAVDSVNGQIGVVVLDLDDVADVNAPTPSDGQVLTWDSGTSTWVPETPTGGGTPGGSDTQVQFNDAGVFGGDAGLVYNKTTGTLTLVNLTATGIALTAASTSGSAGLRVPHGTAPSSPTNGDVWTTTAGMYVRINGVTVGPLAAAGGGSLTNWSEGVNTSAPNATVPAVYFQVSNAATNVDAVPGIAKGTGATLAQIPDNTTTGGNKRGTYATDWQKNRSSASLVADGNSSTIGGGRNNRAGGVDATVAGGNGNSAGGIASFASGLNNSATGNYSGSIGSGNSSGGQYSWSWGFQTNSAAQYSSAGGGNSTVRSMYGAIAHASGGFGGALGDGQRRTALLLSSTTNATQGTSTADMGAASTSNTLILPNTSAFVVEGSVVCRENATGDTSAWKFTALIKRGANAASTAMVVACTPTLVGQDAGAATWAVAVDADTTLGGLRCRVTGEAAHNIKWQWDIHSCNEVVG